jgi:hypothetical protein
MWAPPARTVAPAWNSSSCSELPKLAHLVLLTWGPGKFDAELFMDGKAFRPDGTSGAVMTPPAYGLAGFNPAHWTRRGSVTYWNAFVANLEMHGQGRSSDLHPPPAL